MPLPPAKFSDLLRCPFPRRNWCDSLVCRKMPYIPTVSDNCWCPIIACWPVHPWRHSMTSTYMIIKLTVVLHFSGKQIQMYAIVLWRIRRNQHNGNLQEERGCTKTFTAWFVKYYALIVLLWEVHGSYCISRTLPWPFHDLYIFHDFKNRQWANFYDNSKYIVMKYAILILLRLYCMQ